MQKVTTVNQLRNLIRQWRKKGLSIAFVPTMGNLHSGHIKLVREAKKQADRVVVSIFVNPTQFGAGEDFENYPRTERVDEDKLTEASVDLLFLPTIFEIYPNKASTRVSVGDLAALHCGAYRMGHFDGVATVVTKLFNMVQPDIAFFGEKDFQQLAVIRNMVQDLNIPVEILGVSTEREKDGLAMSSRNGYLTAKERAIAPKLYQALCMARDEVLQTKAFKTIEKENSTLLESEGFKVDYFSICNADNLQLATENDKSLVILVAAKLGRPRLIDNITFSKK